MVPVDPELQPRTIKDVVLCMGRRLGRFTRGELEAALPHLNARTVGTYLCYLHQEGRFRVVKLRQGNDRGWSGPTPVYQAVDAPKESTE